MKDQKELLEYLIKTAKELISKHREDHMFDKGVRASYEGRIKTYNTLISELSEK